MTVRKFACRVPANVVFDTPALTAILDQFVPEGWTVDPKTLGVRYVENRVGIWPDETAAFVECYASDTPK